MKPIHIPDQPTNDEATGVIEKLVLVMDDWQSRHVPIVVKWLTLGTVASRIIINTGTPADGVYVLRERVSESEVTK